MSTWSSYGRLEEKYVHAGAQSLAAYRVSFPKGQVPGLSIANVPTLFIRPRGKEFKKFRCDWRSKIGGRGYAHLFGRSKRSAGITERSVWT